MFIEKLAIRGFGKFKNMDIKLEKGLNIVYGSNEAGKTTLQWFIKAMLYGLKSGRASKEGILSPAKRFRPWTGSVYSGSIEYRLDNGACFRVDRDFECNTTQIFDESFNNITSAFEMSREKCPLFADKQLGLNEVCFEKTVFVKQMETRLDNEGSNELLNRLINVSQTGFEDLSCKRAVEVLKEALKNQIGNDRTSTQPIDRIKSRLEELYSIEKKLIEVRDFGIELAGGLEEDRAEKVTLLREKDYLCKVKELIDIRKKLDTDRVKLDKLNEASEVLRKLERELKATAESQVQIDSLFNDKVMGTRNPLNNSDVKKGNSHFLIFAILLFLSGISLAAGLFINPYGLIVTVLLSILSISYGIYLAVIRKKRKKANVDINTEKKLQYTEISILREYDEKVQKMQELNNNIMDISSKASVICGRQIENATDIEREITEVADNLDLLDARLREGINATTSQGRGTKSDFFKPSELGEVLVDSNPSWLLESLEYEMDKLNTGIIENTQKIIQKETKLSFNNEESEMLQSIQEEVVELEAKKIELEKTGAALRMALDELTNASLEIRKSYAPQLNNKLSEIIYEITGGKYKDLKADDLLSLKAIAPDTGDVRNIGVLSGGTIDQMYLALRLAMAELITFGGEGLPLFLDEAFSQFDDARMTQTLRYLHEKYSAGQVVLFTCKERELEIAKAICKERLNVIMI